MAYTGGGVAYRKTQLGDAGGGFRVLPPTHPNGNGGSGTSPANTQNGVFSPLVSQRVRVSAEGGDWRSSLFHKSGFDAAGQSQNQNGLSTSRPPSDFTEQERSLMPARGEIVQYQPQTTFASPIITTKTRAKWDPRLPKCASQNDWEKVRQLLRELGMEAIDSCDSGGCTVMHWAVRYGKTQFVKEMLENEKAFQFMNINAADSNGVSLVMLAVQYERTKILYHLLDYGADYEHKDNNGKTVLDLMSQWMRSRDTDLLLEYEVLKAAMRRVDRTVLASERGGVAGLLHTMETTNSYVAWRRVCDILMRKVQAEADLPPGRKPVTQQVGMQGFKLLLHLADLEFQDARRVLPVSQLLAELAEADLFCVNPQSIEILEGIMLSCDSPLSNQVRFQGLRIIHVISKKLKAHVRERLRSKWPETQLRLASHGSKNKLLDDLQSEAGADGGDGGDLATSLVSSMADAEMSQSLEMILKSRCLEPLYLVCFFEEDPELTEMAKASLENLGLDSTKPPDVMNWGTNEVMMWLSLSLKFVDEAASAILKEEIDGPSLLYMNDVLVGRLKQLKVRQCIDLLQAVEQLKATHKSWTGYEVFFSYSMNASALVRLYALQMRGLYNCFIDMEGRAARDDPMQIFRRLEECRFFVPFFTEGSIERLWSKGDWVLQEIQKAMELEKIIIPVFYHMQPPDKTGVPESIRNVLRYQAIIHGRDETEQSCVDRLVKYMRDWDNRHRKPRLRSSTHSSNTNQRTSIDGSNKRISVDGRRSIDVTRGHLARTVPKVMNETSRLSVDHRRRSITKNDDEDQMIQGFAAQHQHHHYDQHDPAHTHVDREQSLSNSQSNRSWDTSWLDEDDNDEMAAEIVPVSPKYTMQDELIASQARPRLRKIRTSLPSVSPTPAQAATQGAAQAQAQAARQGSTPTAVARVNAQPEGPPQGANAFKIEEEAVEKGKEEERQDGKEAQPPPQRPQSAAEQTNAAQVMQSGLFRLFHLKT